MIIKINNIKNFGVYQNFNWGSLTNFTQKNLIYGWNYSGKTTLSRLFYCLNNGLINKDYAGGEFEFTLDDGTTINHTNLEQNARLPIIRVFNDDFVKNNLKWNGEGFVPILLLGENSIESSNKIEANNQLIGFYQSKEQCCERTVKDTEGQYEIELTDLASNIKDILKLGTYTKAHVKPVIIEVLQDVNSFFIVDADNLSSLVIKAVSDDKLPEINSINYHFKISTVIDELKLILGRIPSVLKLIQELESNPQLSNWVEQGLEFNHDNGCKFCGNKISQEKIEELQQHFSKDYKDLMTTIAVIKDKISKLKINISMPDENRFYREDRIDYTKSRFNLASEISDISVKIDELLKTVAKKEENPFDKISFDDKILSEESFNIFLNELNTLIKKHNKRCTDFDTERKVAIMKIQKHYIARYIKEKEYSIKLKKVKVFEKLKVRYKKIILNLKEENQSLEAQISSIHKGSENLNKYIHGFLGRTDLQVLVENKNGRDIFSLKRNGNLAINLSEGEKTAIAFSYFLTNLESANLPNSIIFIDDPISSLDSNHIYHVFSLIANILFTGSTLKCKQLLISTHNFEFYNLLKEAVQFKKRTTKFLIRRDSLNKSSIKELPRQLSQFRSEYQYLFKVLHEYHSLQNKENFDLIFVLPNVIRKFLEAYTSARLPNSSGLEDRVKELFTDDIIAKRILKFIHSHSHFNGVIQQTMHDDTFNLCEDTVNYLITWLDNNDNLHYQSLLNAGN